MFSCPMPLCCGVTISMQFTSWQILCSTKHVEVVFYFVCECVAPKEFVIQFISLVGQIADILSKGLLALLFKALWAKLTIVPTPTNLRGSIGDKIT